MPKKLLPAAFCLGLLALSTPTVYAQGSPEVIVRPGDTIEWVAVAAGPHRVKFGAGGTTTSVEDIKKILDNPAISPAGDSAQAVTGPLLSAKVREDATPGQTFVFTCGVHPTDMLSLTFIVAAKVVGEPVRTHKITGEAGRNWHLHVDTKP